MLLNLSELKLGGFLSPVKAGLISIKGDDFEAVRECPKMNQGQPLFCDGPIAVTILFLTPCSVW